MYGLVLIVLKMEAIRICSRPQEGFDVYVLLIKLFLKRLKVEFTLNELNTHILKYITEITAERTKKSKRVPFVKRNNLRNRYHIHDQGQGRGRRDIGRDT
jgi:hypothetical protein